MIAAEQTRALGIVAFHPLYTTPDKQFLLRHRFGHMYPPDKLRGWFEASNAEHDNNDEHAAADDDKIATTRMRIPTDEELQWAGSYMRRSPR